MCIVTFPLEWCCTIITCIKFTTTEVIYITSKICTKVWWFRFPESPERSWIQSFTFVFQFSHVSLLQTNICGTIGNALQDSGLYSRVGTNYRLLETTFIPKNQFSHVSLSQNNISGTVGNALQDCVPYSAGGTSFR